MNWYCDVYCAHYGDNVAHEGDSTAVPIFYKLIEDGIARRDRTLLMHLLDNVSELVSDNGLIKTALALLFHTMSLLGDSAAVKEIDSAPSDRDDGFSDSVSCRRSGIFFPPRKIISRKKLTNSLNGRS